ncbi:MAG: hypothetical protein K0R27_1302 [Xanthobacteraceae bacterium]|nr:hypothetical protein [Xanthobacteraceae bacterium]
MPRRPSVHETASTRSAASNGAHAAKTRPQAAKTKSEAHQPVRHAETTPQRSGKTDSAADSARLKSVPAREATTPLGAALLDVAHATRAALALENPVTAIHKTRRALKEARALLLLVDGQHRPAARQLRRELGDAAHSLGSARDRHIIHDAIAELTSHKRHRPLDDALARRIVGSLAGRGAGQTSETPADLHALRASGLAEKIADHVHLASDIGTEDLAGALTTGYRRARSAARGIDRDDAEALHEVRKQVVAHVCQMELAAPWWPRLGELWLKELQRLRGLLGRHHDLEILLTKLDEAPGRLSPDQVATAMDAASQHQRTLARKALRRHARLFAERPRAFLRRHEAYLHASMDRAENRE